MPSNDAREKQWKAKVAELGCIQCRKMGVRDIPAQLHHVREGQGMSQRSSHWLIVPLCLRHHTGADGIHSGTFYMKYRADEMDLLAMTIEAVYG